MGKQVTIILAVHISGEVFFTVVTLVQVCSCDNGLERHMVGTMQAQRKCIENDIAPV